jgi:hypothetical protein
MMISQGTLEISSKTWRAAETTDPNSEWESFWEAMLEWPAGSAGERCYLAFAISVECVSKSTFIPRPIASLQCGQTNACFWYGLCQTETLAVIFPWHVEQTIG